MLEMCKTVLERVSFDRRLFEKELIKTKRWLKKDELNTLKAWCITTFGASHLDVIMDVFDSFA